jgi:hypothetical protein
MTGTITYVSLSRGLAGWGPWHVCRPGSPGRHTPHGVGLCGVSFERAFEEDRRSRTVLALDPAPKGRMCPGCERRLRKLMEGIGEQ